MKDEVRTHKDLEVWQRSVELVTKIYHTTADFPREEMYGLTSQIQRSAVSIPSNIAEGAARNSTKELIQYLYIAMGSLAELETQLVIAKNLDYSLHDSLFDNIVEIRRMLLSLITSLKHKISK